MRWASRSFERLDQTSFLQFLVAQQEAHPFNQQARIQALLCEVAGACRIRIADRRQVVSPGQHQYREMLAIRPLANRSTGFDPGHVGHHHVENDQCRDDS